MEAAERIPIESNEETEERAVELPPLRPLSPSHSRSFPIFQSASLSVEPSKPCKHGVRPSRAARLLAELGCTDEIADGEFGLEEDSDPGEDSPRPKSISAARFSLDGCASPEYSENEEIAALRQVLLDSPDAERVNLGELDPDSLVDVPQCLRDAVAHFKQSGLGQRAWHHKFGAEKGVPSRWKLRQLLDAEAKGWKFEGNARMKPSAPLWAKHLLVRHFIESNLSSATWIRQFGNKYGVLDRASIMSLVEESQRQGWAELARAPGGEEHMRKHPTPPRWFKHENKPAASKKVWKSTQKKDQTRPVIWTKYSVVLAWKASSLSQDAFCRERGAEFDIDEKRLKRYIADSKSQRWEDVAAADGGEAMMKSCWRPPLFWKRMLKRTPAGQALPGWKKAASVASTSLCGEEMNFFCGECGAGFATKWLLEKHKLNDCVPDSDVLLSTEEDVKKNGGGFIKREPKLEEPGKAPEVHECSICHQTFACKWNLTQHMKRKHGEGDEEVECHICGMKLLRRLLANHIKVKHDLVRHQCDICDALFTTKADMEKHRRLHLEEAPRVPCPDCGKTFSSLSNMKIHYQVKHEGRCWECDLCGQTFASKVKRDQHRQAHLRDDDSETEKRPQRKKRRKAEGAEALFGAGLFADKVFLH